jgi:hypothetical protein
MFEHLQGWGVREDIALIVYNMNTEVQGMALMPEHEW